MTRQPSVSFTRPNDTTAYASGDLVADTTTASAVTPMTFSIDPAGPGGTYLIRRAIIGKTGTGITNASFRLHIYKSLPTVANGDNGAWSSTSSGYVGSIDIAVDKAFSDGASGSGTLVSSTGPELQAILAPTGKLYGLLEARGVYTPTAQEVFTVTLEAYDRFIVLS